MTPFPSGPNHIPTLKGIPSGVCSGESGPPILGAGCHWAFSFWVENPFTPEWARMLGREAGKPKQSGSIYSALAFPKSLRKYSLPRSEERREGKSVELVGRRS